MQFYIADIPSTTLGMLSMREERIFEWETLEHASSFSM
jgi:hypothetical protein